MSLQGSGDAVGVLTGGAGHRTPTKGLTGKWIDRRLRAGGSGEGSIHRPLMRRERFHEIRLGRRVSWNGEPTAYARRVSSGRANRRG